MCRYTYAGPVSCFDRIVTENWKGETVAETPKKAAANLAYQYKRKNGYAHAAKITIDATRIKEGNS